MAFQMGSRVRITGLMSKPELNDQVATVQGQVTDSSGMPRYTVRLSDGKTMNLKTACLIPIPGGDDGGGGGGMPGFGGAGIPNMEAMMQSLPPWLREKLARGETPTFDDLKRLVGVEASTTELGVLIVMCLGLLWKLGLMRGLIVDASVG